MKTVEIRETSNGQELRIPDEFRFEGDAIVLEPVKRDTWPDKFFEAIRIDDPKFVRSEQGPIPPAPSAPTTCFWLVKPGRYQ